ncbi:MAG: type III-B CRISPR module RAMP protein Cmr6 [Verrucomicrobia bacterium]|nr:type III-B CRISPR module RAMP protein Cmr6 [Verrucomicrobiota bacterium]MCH8528796.1 type III-B CRISPR module RAMP protein Cmr6 [Kiritimatiellia bacterium]
MSGPNFVQAQVLDFIKNSPTLTPSLLLSKYAQVGKAKGYKEVPPRTRAVKAVCKAVPLTPKSVPVWIAHPESHVLYMTLKSRLMINMAGGVIENGNLNLHPLTSQPYLPGSAVKGVARHAAWRMWKEETDPTLKAALALSVAEVFGYPTGDKSLDAFLMDQNPNFKDESHLAGSIVFLDAHPLDNARLEEEILTPHTGRNPVPNVFPAVAAGATFVFALLPGRRLAAFSLEKREQLWTLAQSWLREALTEDGIGAKTSAGYGWFVENIEIAERKDQESQAEQDRLEKERAEAERLAALSPVDQFKEDFLAMGPEPFAHAAKEVGNFETDKQKAFLLVVASREKKDWWKGKKKRAKKDPKDQTVVDVLTQLAAKHKVELS